MKKIKDGAVNNKKKTKYCGVCNTWVPFTQNKKHRYEHQDKQIEEAVNQASTTNEISSEWQEIHRLRRELDMLSSKLQRKERVLSGYRDTLGAAGRLLASLVDVSEIN